MRGALSNYKSERGAKREEWRNLLSSIPQIWIFLPACSELGVPKRKGGLQAVQSTSKINSFFSIFCENSLCHSVAHGIGGERKLRATRAKRKPCVGARETRASRSLLLRSASSNFTHFRRGSRPVFPFPRKIKGRIPEFFIAHAIVKKSFEKRFISNKPIIVSTVRLIIGMKINSNMLPALASNKLHSLPRALSALSPFS